MPVLDFFVLICNAFALVRTIRRVSFLLSAIAISELPS